MTKLFISFQMKADFGILGERERERERDRERENERMRERE